MRKLPSEADAAQRSYSIASAPDDGEQVALTVERIEDGEVSPYLVDELAIGDQLEFRGPIDGYFVWSTEMDGPLLFVGGGSGVCPLMAMLRHRAAQRSTVPTQRIDQDMLAAVAFARAQQPLCMVCGPTPLVEVVATTLVELDHSPDRIKTERFGPTGG